MLDHAGAFFFNNGQKQRAIMFFKESVQQKGDDWDFLQHYIQALSSLGRFSQVHDLLEKFLCKHPQHFVALQQVANVLGELGHHEEVRTKKSLLLTVNTA